MLVCFNVSAAECSFSMRDFDHVEHPITLEEVIRPPWDELRVWAVTDVSSAVEAAREGALRHRTCGGGELAHRSKVAGEYACRIESGVER